MNVEPVSLTKKAAKQVQKIKLQKGIDSDYALRIDVKGNASGCGSFGYKIGFDTKKDTDIEYSNHNVKILVDKKKVLFLIDLLVDYLDEHDQSGFFFDKKKPSN